MKHQITAEMYGKAKLPWQKPVVTEELKEEFSSIYNANRRVFDLEYKGYENIKLIPANDRAAGLALYSTEA